MPRNTPPPKTLDEMTEEELVAELAAEEIRIAHLEKKQAIQIAKLAKVLTEDKPSPFKAFKRLFK